MFYGVLSDSLVKSGRIKVVNARRLFNSIGTYGPAVGLIWLAYVGCDGTMAVVALCLSSLLGTAATAGYQV